MALGVGTLGVSEADIFITTKFLIGGVQKYSAVVQYLSVYCKSNLKQTGREHHAHGLFPFYSPRTKLNPCQFVVKLFGETCAKVSASKKSPRVFVPSWQTRNQQNLHLKNLCVLCGYFFELNFQPTKQTEISDSQNLASLAFALRFGLKLNNKFVD